MNPNLTLLRSREEVLRMNVLDKARTLFGRYRASKALASAGRFSRAVRGATYSASVVLFGALASISVLLAVAIYEGYLTQASAGGLTYGEWGIIGVLFAILAVFLDMKKG